MVDRLTRNNEVNARRIQNVEACFGGAGRPLLQPGRVLVVAGELDKKCSRKLKARQFFLFNDLLVYGSILANNRRRYYNQRVIPLEEVQLENLEDDEGDARNGWLVKTRTKSFAVYADTRAVKREWMCHIERCIQDWVNEPVCRVSPSKYPELWAPDRNDDANKHRSAEKNVSSSIWTGAGTSQSARDEEKKNMGNGGTDQEDQPEDDEFGAEEESTSMRAEELPELPNVEGLVQSRELLTQVLLPCGEFLMKAATLGSRLLSRCTAGCLMAFRIAWKEGGGTGGVIVDEITSVKGSKQQQINVHFKLFRRDRPVAVAQLVAVHERELTDQVFDQWLQRLTIANEPVPNAEAKLKRKAQAIDQLNKEAEWAKRLETLGRLNIASLVVTGQQLAALADNFALEELRRVLAGCFVIVKNVFVLGLTKQPTVCGLFVVPVVPIDANRTLFHFLNNQQIPIRHSKTTELGLHNVDDSQNLCRKGKLVLQWMAKLNIPLPDKEEIARRRHRLDDALMTKASNWRQHTVKPTNVQRKQRQQLPGSSGAIKFRQPLQNQLPPPGQTGNISRNFFTIPLIRGPPLPSPSASTSSSAFSSSTPSTFFNRHGPIGGGNGQQQRQKKRRFAATENDAGKVQDGCGKRQRSQ